MKKYKPLFAAVLFLAAIAFSFSAGRYVQAQEHREQREQRCRTLIKFAIAKAEDKDLSDEVVLDALLSNLYAAHEFCDDPYVSAQLNDLWNTLIVKGASHMESQEALADQLREFLVLLGQDAPE